MRQVTLGAILAAACVLACTARAHASARLVSVTPVDGGCVAGPEGVSVQFWNLQPGKTYELTLTHVTDCANGGTDATIDVRVNSSGVGNTDAVATQMVPGTYRFTFAIPAGARCTMPIFYCTMPGVGSSGMFVRRNDGDMFQAHLRMASFGSGCTNPDALEGGDCLAVATRARTWAQVKSIYR